MSLMIKSIMTASMLIGFSTVFAEVKCTTPLKIEIYDEGSRHAAKLLKSKIGSKSKTTVKIENIVNDQYGYPRRKLPYVHTNATIFSRKGIDSACVADVVKSLKVMGFEKDQIAYRSYAHGSKSDIMRVSIPPRTFLYEYDGKLTINP